MKKPMLPMNARREIEGLIAEGGKLVALNEDSAAWEKYKAALSVVPDPAYDWEVTTSILMAMGDLLVRKPDYRRALEAFQDAVRCAGGLGNPHLHLRIGQCHFELGDYTRAADELARAYMGGGRDIFASLNPKYFSLGTVSKPLVLPIPVHNDTEVGTDESTRAHG